jgi:hypothetical protein
MSRPGNTDNIQRACLSTHRPETALILAAARVGLGPGELHQIQTTLRHSLDWDYLLRMARRNRVLPLLRRSLRTVGTDSLPPEVVEPLRAEAREISLHNLRMTGALFKLLDLLGARGIQAIPYKGPTLAVLAYGDLALREFADLDVLVHQDDFTAARDLLIAQGFRPPPFLPETRQTAYVDAIGQLPLVSSEGILVELHLGFAPPDYGFRLDLDRLRQRLIRVPTAGRDLPTFAAEDTLLILCAHGERHWWGSLGWICDVAELVRAHSDLRWESVLEDARRLHGQRLMLLGLALANELLRAPIPAAVAARIQADRSLPGLVANVRRWLFRDSDDHPGALFRALFHFRARERWRDGARYCLSRWLHHVRAL